MTLVAGIVRETESFCQIFKKRADREEVFQMKALTDNLIMDVIGRVAL